MFDGLSEILYGIKNFHRVGLGNIASGLSNRYPLCCVLQYSIRLQITYILPFKIRCLLIEKHRSLKPTNTQLPCLFHHNLKGD